VSEEIVSTVKSDSQISTAAEPSASPAAPLPPALPPGQVAMVPSKKSGKSASKYPAPQVQAPLPPPTSRFADRFAPPRPPTRQMNNVEADTPRHAQKFDPKLANAWKTKSGRELTEAEVLAMPESEYMGDKQIEFFRVKLQSLKDDLLSNAGETTEHLREDTSIVPDPADRATIEEEHALELRTRDRERKLLKKISQSLARLDSGEYGFCDETGEPIGLGRLIARPTATLSLEAQQRRELKQKMFGD
jgi:DnaK suppressor protein